MPYNMFLMHQLRRCKIRDALEYRSKSQVTEDQIRVMMKEREARDEKEIRS
jgi:hypothetical protein